MAAVSASLPLIQGATYGHFIPQDVFTTLTIGACALIFGSLLPDIDGKGRIRWIIGPMLGAMAVIPPLALLLGSMDVNAAIAYLSGEGAVTFSLMSVLGYLSLLIPMRHRGIMHRGSASLIFGIAVGSYSLFSAGLDMPQFAVVSFMAFTGYAWHLALDGSLFKG